ncbi:MAG: hypothetical protein KC547_19560, partial [Anaerolineae bacterium]|nr:hypothetical protein [Anaerolineae bacterium]
YESNARFENFVIRALAYVSGRTREDIEQNTKPGEREDLLLGILDREEHLLVLDGLERILIAYARMDAAHLADSDYDRETANYVAGAHGLPESAGQSFVGEVGLRKCADPRAGQFLRKLATVRGSRILISTRLYPAELQAVTGSPMPGCFALFLPGLRDDDAVTLWRAFGVSGARDDLLPVFRQIDSHPLLIQALAGEVARYRGGPGDFAAWRTANPTFDPFQHRTLAERQAHVLEHALRELDPDAKRLLSTLAAFRGPAGYETLAAVTVARADGGDEEINDDADDDMRKERAKPIFASHHALDDALTTLEDRGLVGWDRRANRYDLHPIVRGVVWNSVGAAAKRDIYGALETHFSAMPTIDDYLQVESLDDLTPVIELYNALIGQGRYDDAEILFYDRINYATLYRLSAARQRIEMLERLFPDGLDQLPRLSKPDMQAFTLSALGTAYVSGGQPRRAAPQFARANDIYATMTRSDYLSIGLGNLSNALRLSSGLYEAEHSARRALVLTHEPEDRFWKAINLYWLGLALAARGDGDGREQSNARNGADALTAFRRALRLFRSQNEYEGVTYAYLAQRAAWRGEYASARRLADHAWELAHYWRFERDFIRAACRQGQAALGLSEFNVADDRLHHALTRARAVNDAENELSALTSLAELRRRQRNL